MNHKHLQIALSIGLIALGIYANMNPTDPAVPSTGTAIIIIGSGLLLGDVINLFSK